MMTTEERRENIRKALERQAALRASGELVTKSPAEKLIEAPTLRRAVKMFCYECSGYSRPAAINCDCRNCALWLFRNGRSKPIPKDIPVWQKKYTHHLTLARELGSKKRSDEEETADN